MRILRGILAGLLFFGLASFAMAGNEKLIKEVEAIGDALAEAMLAGDVETMLDMYMDDAISLPNFAPSSRSLIRNV